MISPYQRQAAFPQEAEFAQVLHNPALRGSADLPGVETKLWAISQKPLQHPSVLQLRGQFQEKALILSCFSIISIFCLFGVRWAGKIKIKYAVCFAFHCSQIQVTVINLNLYRR